MKSPRHADLSAALAPVAPPRSPDLLVAWLRLGAVPVSGALSTGRHPVSKAAEHGRGSGWWCVARRWLHGLASMLAVAAGLAAALVAPTVSAQVTDLTITQAQVTRGDAPTFPDQAPLRNVTLPDLWERANHEEGPSWYRLQFNIAAPDTGPLLGAYLEQACARVELRLNGQLLHADTSARSGGAVRGCHVGVLVALPASLLVAGANHIDIRLEGQPLERVAVRERAAMLGPLQIAPMADLASQAQVQHDINAGLAIALTTAVGIAGLGALGLAWLSRLPYLGWFAAACLGWAGLSGALLYSAPAMPGTWTDFMLCAAVPPIGLAGMMFLLRYCGLALSWLDSALALQCVVVPLSLVIAVPDRLHGVARPWAYILLVEITAVLAVFLHRAWRMSRPDFWVVALAIGGFVATWLAEAVLADVPAALPGQAALNVGLLIVFGGLGWRLHQLLQKALATADATRLQLEKRVQEVVSEAERSIDQAAVVRVEEVATKERKRIAADLHDDLGAKLLTIVHTSNDERISTLAREALEEMRLSVRGLSGKPVQLGDSVGDWRSEAMSRLSQGGIELVWNVSDDLLMSERKISARAYVQTTRILREAVSNMIKHSGATQCEIGIRLNDNDFEFNIVDNGKGIPMELDGKLDRGHGMSTMKTRAKQLQGQCLVESGPGFGTAIRLTLPL